MTGGDGASAIVPPPVDPPPPGDAPVVGVVVPVATVALAFAAAFVVPFASIAEARPASDFAGGGIPSNWCLMTDNRFPARVFVRCWTVPTCRPTSPNVLLHDCCAFVRLPLTRLSSF